MMIDRIVQHGRASVNRFIKIPIDVYSTAVVSRC
jgi:hypothetical protein